MKVMYVAPRYHTNQVPIIKGWIDNKHEVIFLSQFAKMSEDYSVCSPIVLGYSWITECLMSIYRFLFCRKEKSVTKEFNIKTKIGIPPIKKASQYIDSFEPDVVIVRERSLYNIPFVMACRQKNISCILYNQSPLWDKPGRDAGWKKKLLLPLLPNIRMTPVMGEISKENEKTKGASFVPFVVETHFAPDEKEHFINNQVRIVCVGRYEKRKNLLLLLEATRNMLKNRMVYLTIIGELLDDNQREYYDLVRRKITEYGLETSVALLTNLTMQQVYAEYRKADIFVLPSTRERASIAQLEAMSCSLPVICSDTNGSACYVEENINGYLFKDNSLSDLTEKIECLVLNRDRILKMGEKSFQLIGEKYQFENYFNAIINMMKRS